MATVSPGRIWAAAPAAVASFPASPGWRMRSFMEGTFMEGSLMQATLTAGTRAPRDARRNALFRTENPHGQDRLSVGAGRHRVPRHRRLRLADAAAAERADPDPVRGRRRRLGGGARADRRRGRAGDRK